jgi:4-hydroxybenzoate polyprenyltransferase
MTQHSFNAKPAVLQNLKQRLVTYARLMRLDKPIGILLLLWPTYWALWLAAEGTPSFKNFVIFTLGVALMRSAGCVINDFADRKVDAHVKRTQHRPIATGLVSPKEALVLFVVLCLIAFGLVLLTNTLTVQLSFIALALAACYPFMKRYTHLPQVILGAAYGFGIPMAFAAEAGELNKGVWLLFIANVLWTVAYDTFYAMVDRDDDLKIGVKSTAVLFGEQDRFMTAMLQVLTLYTLYLAGRQFELGGYYLVGLAVAAGFFIYQQWLIRYRVREACFRAFLNNTWPGLAIFLGIFADLSLS